MSSVVLLPVPPVASGPKSVAGAPSTPENTMFHTPPSQRPTSELRVYHCCCEPVWIVPVTREFARYPPEAYSPIWPNTVRSPRMSTRRMGAACETAQRIWCGATAPGGKG